MNTCLTCIFWEQYNTLTEGECHRYAPRAARGRKDQEKREVYASIPLWPLTLSDEWCGEWAGAEIEEDAA